MNSKPNILLILTDQHRYDILGVNGSKVCRSPSLDKLAGQGVNFSRAYSVCALCTPARASIYTGLLPHKHGLTRNTETMQSGLGIPSTVPTLAERLGDAGYRSYFAGKWHAGARGPSQCGFDGMDVSGYGDVRNHPEYHEYLEDRGLAVPEMEISGVGWAHNLGLAGRMSGPVEASVPRFLADRTIGYLKDAGKRDEPFFVALNFWGPHAPYLPSEPYASMYDPASIPPWGNFEDTFEGKPPIYSRYRDAFTGEGKPLRTWEECAKWAALYFGFATQIDAEIGRVLAELESSGLDRNTVVVFSTDHGDLTGAHGGMHDKDGIMCQELYHVPMIASVPSMGSTGVTCDLPCSNLDIASTILDLADCSVSDELDSRSLVPLLRGEVSADRPDYVVGEFFGSHFAYESRMVVHGDFKYVFHPGAFDELYDLRSDPWEMTNLIETRKCRPVLDACRQRLLEWSRKTGDDLCILSGLFEERDEVAAGSFAPYNRNSMDALRDRPPRLIR